MFEVTVWWYFVLYLVGIVLSLRFYKKNRKQYTFLLISFSLFILWTVGFRFSHDLDFSLLKSDPTSEVRNIIETVIYPLISLIDIAGWIMLLIAISIPAIAVNAEKNSDATS